MEAEVVDAQNNLGSSEEVRGTKNIKRKTHLKVTVSKITLGGAIVDIGMDKPGFIHLARIREETVNRVEDVLEVGQAVDVWVLRADPQRKHVELTMIEPLKLEWREIKKGMVVEGGVTRIEKYGVFVEIGAERPGLVHISELAHKYVTNPHEVVSVGDEIEAKVLAVNRRKKQIKLSIKALLDKKSSAEVIPTAKEALQEDEEESDVIPTAMEMALREAMEKSREDGEPIDKPKQQNKNQEGDELGNILSRTLESYASQQ
jgi:predicted RNA-binding protein with RPS1 domain